MTEEGNTRTATHVQTWSVKFGVYAYSYFASVECATAMLDVLEMYFTGVVKNCTKNFPKSYLDSCYLAGQGDSLSMVLKREDKVILIALAYADRHRFTFISSQHRTTLGQPNRRERWRNIIGDVDNIEKMSMDISNHILSSSIMSTMGRLMSTIVIAKRP